MKQLSTKTISMLRTLCLVTALAVAGMFASTQSAKAHGTQVAYCLLNNGFLRVYIEHWHGDLTRSALTGSNAVNLNQTVNGVTTNFPNLLPDGLHNNRTINSLPGCGNNIVVQSTCPGTGFGSSNYHNDWVYYDFAPAGFGAPLTITINAGNSVLLTEACGGLYPSSVTATFQDNAGPIIFVDGVDCGNVNVNNVCTPQVVNFTITLLDARDPNPFIVSGPTPASGSTFPLGCTNVTVSASDDLNNISNCTFQVCLNQPIQGCCTAPVLSCPSNIAANNDPGICGAAVSFPQPTFTDGCPPVVVTQTGGAPSGSVFPKGSSTITYTATDANGNQDQCSFIITVSDNENPVLNCPSVVTAVNDPGQCGATLSYSVSASDNCPGVLFFQTSGLGSGSFFPVGTTSESYAAVDASGNNVVCQFNVVVSDGENPVLNCPSNITVNNDPGVCGAAVMYRVTSSDNCPGVAQFQLSGLGSGAVFPVGTTTESYAAVDASGNNVTCSFTVTVNDNEAPIITCPSDLLLSCQDQIQPANANDASATDNCDPNPALNVVEVDNGGTGCGSNPLIITRTYTATDIYGNSSTCAQTITVIRDSVLTAGICARCDAQVTASLDCSDENCVSVSSCKDLSNVVLMDVCGNEFKFDELNQGQTGYFCHPSGLPIVTVWIKSGCYQSGDGPGYGHRLDFCQPAACKAGAEAQNFDVAETTLMAYPNPFSSKTAINFSIGTDSEVSLTVYNVAGQQVAELYKGSVEANKSYEFEFNSNGMPSGLYLAKLATKSGESKLIRLVLNK